MKIKAEEQRYIKLYGSEIISMEQLEEAIGGLRLKRVGLERQVSRAAETKAQTDVFPLATADVLESYSKRAEMGLQLLEFGKKRAIIEHCLDKVIADQQELRVYGYLPVGEQLNYVKFYSEGRNCGIAKRREVDAV